MVKQEAEDGGPRCYADEPDKHDAPKPDRRAPRGRPPNRSGRQGPRQKTPSTSRPRSRLCYGSEDPTSKPIYDDLTSEPIYDDSSTLDNYEDSTIEPIYDDPTSDTNLQMSSFSRRHR